MFLNLVNELISLKTGKDWQGAKKTKKTLP